VICHGAKMIVMDTDYVFKAAAYVTKHGMATLAHSKGAHETVLVLVIVLTGSVIACMASVVQTVLGFMQLVRCSP